MLQKIMEAVVVRTLEQPSQSHQEFKHSYDYLSTAMDIVKGRHSSDSFLLREEECIDNVPETL